MKPKMLTAHISKYIISAEKNSYFQFCTEPLATGYYLKANVLSYYNAQKFWIYTTDHKI